MGPTPVFSEDDLIGELQRAGQLDSLTGPPQRTGRQRLRLLAVSALVVGALIAATIWVRQPDPFTASELTPWRHPVVSQDGRDITVNYNGGVCGIESVRTIVEESTSRVAVTVVTVTQYSGEGDGCPLIAIRRKAVAHLNEPLGSRKLVDGRCQQPASLEAERINCTKNGYNPRAWPPH